MASRNKDERAHVNALIKAIQKNTRQSVFVHVDRDAGSVRHTSSGFDFMLACDGRAVFCEAKEGRASLSTWQEFVRADVLASDTPYLVVRFYDDGANFTIDGGATIETARARINDFIGGLK